MQDFKSQLALQLRRKMLLTLAKKEFKDEAHEKEMLHKYGDCIIPVCTHLGGVTVSIFF